MAENTIVVHTAPPPNASPDYYRQALKALADANNLTFNPEMVYDEPKRGWWANYHLTNPDGSNFCFLGSACGTSKPIAKEWAASQAYATLITLIQRWRQGTS